MLVVGVARQGSYCSFCMEMLRRIFLFFLSHNNNNCDFVFLFILIMEFVVIVSIYTYMFNYLITNNVHKNKKISVKN